MTDSDDFHILPSRRDHWTRPEGGSPPRRSEEGYARVCLSSTRMRRERDAAEAVRVHGVEIRSLSVETNVNGFHCPPRRWPCLGRRRLLLRVCFVGTAISVVFTFSRGALLALIVVALMLFVFTLAVIAALLRGLDISCGCFTQDPQAGKIGWMKVVQNLSLFFLSIFLFYSNANKFSLDQFLRNQPEELSEWT